MFVAWMLAQAAVAPAQNSLQARFEAATTALLAEKWGDALNGFQTIEAEHGISARTRGVVLMREATALWHLDRDEEAVDAFRRGLALAPKSDSTLRDDRREALFTLGGLDRDAYDYAAARRDFAEALELSDEPAARLRALLALTAVTMFDDSKAALDLINQAGELAAKNKLSREAEGTIRDLRGKVLLNRGDPAAALAELEIALKDFGGLTSKTDLNDVAVRSDLALAALKAKQNDKAREYLGMTGEGRLPEGPFAAPADTEVPHCGGDIRPDDVAVIEFGIGDDGNVTFASPVYASRQGPMAVQFAQAVSGWTWRAADVKSIPAFYRALTRVELRCSSAIKRPGDLAQLWPALAQWFADHGFPSFDQDSLVPATLRAELDRRKDAPRSERIPYLYMLASAPTTEANEARELFDQVAMLTEQEHAPVAVSTSLRIAALGKRLWFGARGATEYREGLRALLAQPAVAADARTAGVIRLLLAAPQRGGAPRDAGELLAAVTEDGRLDPHDPLRVGALLRLSAVQVQHGDVAAARATYLRTGLSAQQCALVDVQPAVRRTGVGSNDYPVDAARWGIGGWTRVEFDVLPDGRTVNRRAIMSYPPFVFGDPTVKAMESARFTQSYRPEGEIGCSAASLRFRYAMPGH